MRGAQLAGALADDALEVGMENIWKARAWAGPLRDPAVGVLAARELAAEVERDRMRKAAMAQHRLVAVVRERVEAPVAETPERFVQPCLFCRIVRFHKAAIDVEAEHAILPAEGPHVVDAEKQLAVAVGGDNPIPPVNSRRAEEVCGGRRLRPAKERRQRRGPDKTAHAGNDFSAKNWKNHGECFFHRIPPPWAVVFFRFRLAILPDSRLEINCK